MTPVRKTRIPHDVEKAILALAAERPILGRIRAAAEINRRGFKATPSTVRTIWRRYGLENSEKRIRAFAVDHGSRGAALSQEAPSYSHPPDDHAGDAFVFSVMALAVLGSIEADTLGQPSAHDLDLWSQTMPALHEDHAAFAGYDAPTETAHMHQPVLPHSDFLV